MINNILISACCVAMALFSGCVLAPQIPVELQYSAPPAGVPVATIRGSEERSVLLDDFTAFIVAIDGRVVMAGRKGWDTPIPIEAGYHSLNVKFARGVYYAREDFDLDAVAGANYQLRHTSDVKLFGNHSYVDFWIEDMATSKAVSPVKQASVAGGDSSAPPFVPIFIPAK
jgi:hypothetical protein